jgi:hypothetical protein
VIIELIGGSHDGRRLCIPDGVTGFLVVNRPDAEPLLYLNPKHSLAVALPGATMYRYVYRETAEGLPAFRSQA